jgi:hypothetical protein
MKEVVCINKVDGFTIGRKYKVLGSKPRYFDWDLVPDDLYILLDDNDKKSEVDMVEFISIKEWRKKHDQIFIDARDFIFIKCAGRSRMYKVSARSLAQTRPN